MLEQLKHEAIQNNGDILIVGEVGKFEGLTIIFDDLIGATAPAPAPKQHRIQHGPVRKGRGGKPKRW